MILANNVVDGKQVDIADEKLRIGNQGSVVNFPQTGSALQKSRDQGTRGRREVHKKRDF